MSDKDRKLSVRVPAGLHKRLKLAAVAADMPIGRFLEHLLDDRDKRLEKARRLQKSPLHRVAVDD